MFECEKCGVVFSKYGIDQHQQKCKLSRSDIANIIDDYVNKEYSIRNIKIKYNVTSITATRILSGKTRTLSESMKIIRKNNPVKLSDERKQILREARLKWMKENPDKTAWRNANLSYPEKVFLQKLTEIGFDKKFLIVREKSVYPYFIDFAFENEKIAVEIDGSQHLLKERLERDIKKDKKLNELGWRVLRITAKQVLEDINSCFNALENFIGSSNINESIGVHAAYNKENVGIVKIKKEYRCECGNLRSNGSITCMECYNKRRKLHIRPSYEILCYEIAQNGFSATGRKYNVSDNSIRKWIKNYEK